MGRSNSDLRPVFIVGPSRSGTTLLGGCLNAVSDLHIADETHYFSDLRRRDIPGDRADLSEEDRKRVEDYFLALTHRFYGDGGMAERATMPREDLRELAEERGATPDAYFEAFCRLRADGREISRWGEKTPRHVFDIPELLDAYPDAQVICMIRDPRAVVASYRDFKKYEITERPEDEGKKEALEEEARRVALSYHVVIASLIWKSTIQAEQRALERWGPERIRLVRYEDLVSDPHATLSGLTEWLGLRFDVDALSTVPIGTSSYSGITSDVGVSSAGLQRWREKMTPAEIRTVQICTRSTATALGYEMLDERATPAALLMPWLSLPWVALRVLWVNRSRTGGILGALGRRLQALVRS